MIQSPVYWLWLFATALAMWRLPGRFRLGLVGLSCLGYLASIELTITLVVTGLALTFFYIPRFVAQRRLRTRLFLFLGLGILGYLLYHKLRLPNIVAPALQSGTTGFVLPLGISYFTFKFIHYAIEVNRGNLRQHGFLDFLAYMTLVPIFTAGPIERFDHFMANRESDWSLDSLVAGLTRITHGLIKRFVIADLLVEPLLRPYTSSVVLINSLDELSTVQLWRYLLLLFVITYLEFSAYSDIAIGGARLFGLRIMENFNWPILAPNIAQFWRRWHMTLAGWCQTYIYMPGIGLTRNPYLSTYAAFFVIGVWHGATLGWLLWGLYHATGVAIFVFWTRTKRKRKWAIPDTLPLRIVSTCMTLAFVSAAGLLPALSVLDSSWTIVRAFAKLVFLEIS